MGDGLRRKGNLTMLQARWKCPRERRAARAVVHAGWAAASFFVIVAWARPESSLTTSLADVATKAAVLDEATYHRVFGVAGSSFGFVQEN